MAAGASTDSVGIAASVPGAAAFTRGLSQAIEPVRIAEACRSAAVMSSQ